jgi:hypothetical protein
MIDLVILYRTGSQEKTFTDIDKGISEVYSYLFYDSKGRSLHSLHLGIGDFGIYL